MQGDKFSHQNDQLSCPECGHELDLPPPTSLGRLAMTEAMLEEPPIPQELLDRIEQDATELSAGENDPALRKAVYESAYRILYSRLCEARTI